MFLQLWHVPRIAYDDKRPASQPPASHIYIYIYIYIYDNLNCVIMARDIDCKMKLEANYISYIKCHQALASNDDVISISGLVLLYQCYMKPCNIRAMGSDGLSIYRIRIHSYYAILFLCKMTIHIYIGQGALHAL